MFRTLALHKVESRIKTFQAHIEKCQSHSLTKSQIHHLHVPLLPGEVSVESDNKVQNVHLPIMESTRTKLITRATLYAGTPDQSPGVCQPTGSMTGFSCARK